MSEYTDGDAKWTFDRVPVSPGTTYDFSEYYKSDKPTKIAIEYEGIDGKMMYSLLGDVPASKEWTSLKKNFVPPVGVKSATVIHVIDSIGNLWIDNVSLVVDGTIPEKTNIVPIVVPAVSTQGGLPAIKTDKAPITSSSSNSVIKTDAVQIKAGEGNASIKTDGVQITSSDKGSSIKTDGTQAKTSGGTSLIKTDGLTVKSSNDKATISGYSNTNDSKQSGYKDDNSGNSKNYGNDSKSYGNDSKNGTNDGYNGNDYSKDKNFKDNYSNDYNGGYDSKNYSGNSSNSYGNDYSKYGSKDGSKSYGKDDSKDGNTKVRYDFKNYGSDSSKDTKDGKN